MSVARLALPDVNVLVALTNPTHVFHSEAHRWLSEAERYATTPITESGLVRMLLNPAVTGQTVSVGQALDLLAGVRAETRAEFLFDDTSLSEAGVQTAAISGHRQVTDFHLLNLAVRHGAHLVTFDRKLGRATHPDDGRHVICLG